MNTTKETSVKATVRRNPIWRAALVLFAIFLSECSLSTPYDGTFINRDYPGSKLTIKGGEALLSEGKGAATSTIKGKIVKASKGEFQVSWNVTDPDAIKNSRFVAEKPDSTLAALHEYPLDGLVSDLEIVYYPASAYALGVYVSPKGETMSAAFNKILKTAAVVLPDGEHFYLPQALSASGARYSDGTNTFWEHQGGAIFEIAGKKVFEGLLSGE